MCGDLNVGWCQKSNELRPKGGSGRSAVVVENALAKLWPWKVSDLYLLEIKRIW